MKRRLDLALLTIGLFAILLLTVAGGVRAGSPTPTFGGTPLPLRSQGIPSPSNGWVPRSFNPPAEPQSQPGIHVAMTLPPTDTK